MQNKITFEISVLTIAKIIGAILLVWFLYAIREIIVMFFVVLVIVAAVGPLVDKMSKYIPRLLAIIFLFILFLGILTAIGFLLIPPIVEQIKLLAINLPTFINRFDPIYKSVKDILPNYQDNLLNASSQLGNLTLGFYSTTVGVIGGFVYLFTTLILAVYMLVEKNSIRNLLHQIIPTGHKEVFFGIIRKISYKMGSWLRGQILLIFIIGILDGIALYVLGIPYALTLAVWGGLTEVIPYVGPWLGLIPALIIALAISPWKALFILIAYVLIQQLEGQFLVPKIIGKAVGLSPVIIILSLLAGAKIMGILGMLIAIPVAATLSVIVQEWPEIKKIRENS